MFATQPAKTVESAFKPLVDVQSLLAANDPYAVVINTLEQQPEHREIVTVATDGITLLKNLPYLSLSTFQTNPVVSHVELNTFDFSIVTALRDLSFPILVSQTVAESAKFANVGYKLASLLNKPVFHFYVPAKPESITLSKIVVGGADEPSSVDITSVPELLNHHKVTPFEVVQKVPSPKDAFLYFGQVTEELAKAAASAKVLLISIKLYKPFDLASFLKLIPNSVETLTLIEQSLVATNQGTNAVCPLALDFFSEYPQYQSLKNFSKIITATIGYISTGKYSEAIANILANTRSESPIQSLSFGKLDTELSTKSSIKRTQELLEAIENAVKSESAYLKLLQQVNSNSESLRILNQFNQDSIGVETNPEFGFGAFLYDDEQQRRLIDLVYNAVKENKFQLPHNSELLELLSKWLVQVKDSSSTSSISADDVAKIIEYLGTDSSESGKQIASLANYFSTKNNWLIGSDAWSYDLGSSGVHNVITSGKNVNMLIIDSEPYEEKTQSEKKVNGFRKKDVGLYAMNYGNTYVASVAVYSSYTQVLQAFIEAEKFNGPSIVLAYLPYHSENDNTLSILKETKKAVDSGHWPLYRYDPFLENEKDAFKLDSSSLRKGLKDFLDRENKLTLLASRNPELSRNLTALTANAETKARQAKVADDSFHKLLQGLSGPPLTIAFASDGGNAEALGKKIHRQALARGLKATILAMDDLSVEDLPNETNVVFVSSTSGQGEFPTNGKQFWDGIKGANDLDLSAIKYSVFGLGDSQYWPRKEDKHYYNKPAKDLDAKLKLYGGVELAEIGLGDDQDADGFSTGFNEWIPKIWKALGVDNVDGIEEPKPLTNEDMKIGSDYLRGTIVEGLNDQSTGAICAVDQQLTKFHGIYMQDDRDIRDERKAQGKEPAYAFMVRVRLPGGAATPQQYLKMDELADTRGNGTLKLTTRATFQLHGVVKHDLKPAIRGMNSALMDTLAACGDVNRNVMVSALPSNAKVHSQVAETGTLISEHLLPNTTAYHEIWLEGEDEGDKPGDREVWENRKEGPTKKKTLVAGNALTDVEPMYGPTYLPRKFKIVITVPPYNDVDVWAHDIGLIAIVDEQDNVTGYNLMAGGGMGSTHNNKKTYPRTGSMFGYVSAEKVHLACEKVMLVQRDFGDRTNRKHARLKYTIDDLGVEVFKQKVEELLGFKFEEARPYQIDSNVDYFGWCRDELGFNHFTCFIENGRVEDTPELPQKTGLREIANYLIGKSGEFRLTGNQHLVISNISDYDIEHVKHLLAMYKLDNTDFSALRLSSAACVSLPTCGLAMAESERYLPKLITKLEEAIEEYGLRHDSIVMRMTGCPNGCARPWLAEIALVGKAPGAYNLLLGGGHYGQRLNKIYRYSIKEDEILDILKPMIKRWGLERNHEEPFGDWVIRAGYIKPTTEGKYFHEDIPEDA